MVAEKVAVTKPSTQVTVSSDTFSIMVEKVRKSDIEQWNVVG